jgi:CNT family concentrative nucleoside transporter
VTKSPSLAVSNFNPGTAFVPISSTMADISRDHKVAADGGADTHQMPYVDLSREGHNSSPMPGVVRNNDPALDIAKEHDHTHLHHGAHAAAVHHDNIVYTTGTTYNEPSIIPAADPNDDALHRRHLHGEHDVEKSGGLYGEEKVSMSKGRSSSDPDLAEVDPKRHYVADFYAAYRLFFHIFIGMLFTG